MRLNKKTIAISTTSLLIVGGSAFAAVWNFTGTGSGTGSVATRLPVEFRLAGSLSDIEQTDGTSGFVGTQIPLHYRNPNTATLSGKKIRAQVTGTSSPTACPLQTDSIDNFATTDGAATVFYPTASWAGLDSAALPTVYATTNAPEACQGVSLTLAFSLV